MPALVSCFFLPVFGQKEGHVPNSPEADKVKALLKELDKNSFSSRTVPISDSIINLGKQIKWPAAVGRAYDVQCKYYWQTIKENEFPLFRKKVNEMMAYCNANNLSDGYFGGWNSLIYYYISRSRFDDAFLELKKFEAETRRRNSKIYEAKSHKSFGNLYYVQSRKNLASQEFLKAATLYKGNGSWVSAYDSYFMSASNARESRDYRQALESLKKAEEMITYIKKNQDLFKAEVWNLSGICYYYLGNYDKLLDLRDSVNRMKVNYVDDYTRNLHLEMLAYCYLVRKQYDEALCYADSLTFTNPKYSIRERVFLSKGQYKEATEAKTNYFTPLYNLFNKGAGSYNKLEKTLLELDESEHLKERLDLENKQLALKEELAVQSRKNALMEREALLLEIKSQEAKSRLANAKGLNKRENEKRLASQKEFELTKNLNQTRRLGIILFISVLFVLVIIFLLNLKRRDDYLKQLKKEKDDMLKSQKEAEMHYQEAEKARKEAEDADMIKSQYIRNVSHEIRTPLTAIVGFSNLLASNEISSYEEEKEKFTQIIEENSERLSSIVNDILDLANLTTGKYKMQYSQISVEDLVNMVVATVKPKLNKDTQLVVEVSEECRSLTIFTDMKRVLQALNCLMDNAAKFTSKGFIRFILEKVVIDGREMIQTTISDSGIGVPADKAEAIFERFYKVDEFSKSNGAGLKIARAIASRLQGVCFLNTDYHPGAQFIFRIPYWKELPEKEGGMQ